MTAAVGAPWRMTRRAPSWPERLEHLDQPPAELWVRGMLPAGDAPLVAVVGSRRPSPAGLLTARDLGAQLAAAGIVVVSGLARGIDAAAHHGALAGGGATLAVLGCGIDVCYPLEHRGLRDAIVRQGCLLSEDGGEAAPLSWRFPRRNRIIAALVEAVVVVEASAKSGALSTARWAADLGREVLAVPGSIRNPSSVGSNLLIRDGVRPFLELGDLFETVPALRRALVAPTASAGLLVPPPRSAVWGSSAPVQATPPGAGPSRGPGATGTEQSSSDGDAGGNRRAGGDDHTGRGDPCRGDDQTADPVLSRVLAALGSDPVHPDDLAVAVGLPAAVLVAALTTLNLRGAVTDVSGGRVARTF